MEDLKLRSTVFWKRYLWPKTLEHLVCREFLPKIHRIRLHFNLHSFALNFYCYFLPVCPLVKASLNYSIYTFLFLILLSTSLFIGICPIPCCLHVNWLKHTNKVLLYKILFTFLFVRHPDSLDLASL
jgi:hypothetical protein